MWFSNMAKPDFDMKQHRTFLAAFWAWFKPAKFSFASPLPPEECVARLNALDSRTIRMLSPDEAESVRVNVVNHEGADYLFALSLWIQFPACRIEFRDGAARSGD